MSQLHTGKAVNWIQVRLMQRYAEWRRLVFVHRRAGSHLVVPGEHMLTVRNDFLVACTHRVCLAVLLVLI